MQRDPRCTDLLERATKVLAGGPGTFSKHWEKYPEGLAPVGAVSGEGAYIVGTNGRVYLDTVAALGPVLLGYGHPLVDDALLAQLKRGTSFSLLHPLEVEVGELLCTIMPTIDAVRWCRNGSDATGAAVRLARAMTGKQTVLCCGYHGASSNDWYAVTTDKPAGVLAVNAQYCFQIPFGDFSGVSPAMLDDLAAVIVEVPPFRWTGAAQASPEECAALRRFQTLAHEHGALFILDEVITMLRYGLSGASGYYGLSPDLVTGGKALANGLPLAVLGGTAATMRRFDDGDLFCSYTYAGETTALAACKAVIGVLRDTEALATLWTMGTRLGHGLVDLFAKYALPAEVWGNAARISVRWQDTGEATATHLRTIWLAEHARRGILHGIGVIFPQAIWRSTEVTRLLEAAEATCVIIRDLLASKTACDYAACPPINPVITARA